MGVGCPSVRDRLWPRVTCFPYSDTYIMSRCSSGKMAKSLVIACPQPRGSKFHRIVYLTNVFYGWSQMDAKICQVWYHHRHYKMAVILIIIIIVIFIVIINWLLSVHLHLMILSSLMILSMHRYHRHHIIVIIIMIIDIIIFIIGNTISSSSAISYHHHHYRHKDFIHSSSLCQGAHYGAITMVESYFRKKNQITIFF